jgi:hypothetical protein
MTFMPCFGSESDLNWTTFVRSGCTFVEGSGFCSLKYYPLLNGQCHEIVVDGSTEQYRSLSLN